MDGVLRSDDIDFGLQFSIEMSFCSGYSLLKTIEVGRRECRPVNTDRLQNEHAWMVGPFSH